ncbi:MAG TPA: adenosylcobalamin-dependent ribonucleoside-diphosphate reductase, partial [Acidimicrobiia bacterium]|nr:adenosylcobalamin-dependent ribonucleoside-diphosphate reductase [Acidimicrobiia bacterium]
QPNEAGDLLLDGEGNPVTGGETSSRQVFDRLASTWRWWGEQHGYFASPGDAQSYEDEMKYMLANQIASPNSPQWFNTGLAHAYGITGTPQGFWFVDPTTGEMTESPDSYTHPAPHACFINGVNDDLVNPGGIMDLWVREARLFKMGSGTGSNFSQIRAENEKLSGGGKSSGVMGFLRIGDRAAGAIKSGGTTRRAAKMVILDLDHPDVEEFIDWKMHEENKARVLIKHGGYPADFNGEAYATVSGQNSNNSVRVPNEFIEAVRNDGDWHLTERTSGRIRKTVKARDLWRKVAEAAWACADPGVQYDTIINEWHTSPAGGKIRATNPCSEYVFLDNTACNLASINVVKFYDDDAGVFDSEGYEHAIRLWTITLEISVTMAHFPSREIAQGSYDYRTLGLGYANIGSLLMRMGVPYDSDRGRAVAGALTAILTGYAYATSAELAASVGTFPRFAENREAMLRVIRNHRRAAYNVAQPEYEGLSHFVLGIDPTMVEENLLTAARQSWDLALDLGERYGYRNAQVSVTAPTGTIGLQMDCDTTGIEPDFSLVKFKKLAGGGYFKIVNQSVTPALRKLGYDDEQVSQIVRYIVGTSSLVGAPYINRESLMAKGFTDEDLARIEATLPAVFELKHAFNPFVLGEAALQRLGFSPEEYATFEFDLLRSLGFSTHAIRSATEWVCGQQTIEGAPGLKDEHLAVFDTANRNGRNGQRLIHHTGHIKMLAATQPFLSGAASKTINMPNEATVEDIEESYMMSFELGVKCMALYRDGSKASQPLSSSSDDGRSEEEAEEVTRALEIDKQILWGKIPVGLSPTQAYAQGMHPPRFLLPARRSGYTQEAKIGGHKVYLRTGEYEDGTLGELFIDLAKEGATLRGILSCFAIAVSKGLQFGVPLEEFVDTFTFQTFEPRGLVEGHPNIKMANSIVDYVFRALAVEYLHRDDLAQVPPTREGDLPEPASGLAVEAGVQLDLTDAVAERDVVAVASAVKVLGSSPVGPAPKPVQVARATVAVGAQDAGTAAMQSALSEMMGDAPLCDICGHITIRNGSCYKCLNCGNSLGCS